MYGIWDLDIQKFVYIGKSNDPQGRFRGYMNGRGNEDLQKFIEEKGVDSFRLIILEKTGFWGSGDWVKREKFWITKFREEGHPLCNRNKGGGGVTHHTKETKIKMAEAKVGEKNPNYGGNFSLEHLKNMSIACLGREVTAETRSKIGKANKGNRHTKKTKAKIRKSRLGSHHSEETKAKMSKVKSSENNPMFGKYHTEEAKLKVGNANAKPYPAFYNVKTKKCIQTGYNLAKLCRVHNLGYKSMSDLRLGHSKTSYDGWQIQETKK